MTGNGKNNNFREMYLRIEEEKQVITKKGSSTRDLNLKANISKAHERIASTEIE